MTLTVYTARISARDPDALDITRGGADRARKAGKPAPGAFLAPSAGLVFPTLRALKAAPDEAARAAVAAMADEEVAEEEAPEAEQAMEGRSA